MEGLQPVVVGVATLFAATRNELDRHVLRSSEIGLSSGIDVRKLESASSRLERRLEKRRQDEVVEARS